MCPWWNQGEDGLEKWSGRVLDAYRSEGLQDSVDDEWKRESRSVKEGKEHGKPLNSPFI